MNSFVYILFLVWVVLGLAEEDRLYFNEQGKFKVVQFTDLHYGNNQYENDQTYAVQDAILAAEKPDLVIITGDLVSGYEWDGKEAEWFKKRWRQLVAPMIKHNIRWAVALGNHDVEADLSGLDIVELDSSEPLSLTQPGPIDIGGATNYYLPVYTNDNSSIGQVLWIFDSGNSGCLGVSGWGCVQYDQIEWYRNTSRTLASENSGVVPALAFFHIPLYEHLDLWNVRGVYGDLAEGEGVCCSSVNTGLYSAMKQMGDVKGVYCGHDHSNDYIGDYHGIALGFGRKTGYGCYGPPFGWKHGARVLEIEQHKFGAHTWLRLEDGGVEIQKLNDASMRKFLGCCSMAGHGRVAMGWYGILVASMVNLSFVALVAVCVIWGVKRYRNSRLKQYDSLSADEEENSGGIVDAAVASLKGYNRRDSQTIPRLRRNNANEIACVM
jgi:hypothetical protein